MADTAEISPATHRHRSPSWLPMVAALLGALIGSGSSLLVAQMQFDHDFDRTQRQFDHEFDSALRRERQAAYVDWFAELKMKDELRWEEAYTRSVGDADELSRVRTRALEHQREFSRLSEIVVLFASERVLPLVGQLMARHNETWELVHPIWVSDPERVMAMLDERVAAQTALRSEFHQAVREDLRIPD